MSIAAVISLPLHVFRRLSGALVHGRRASSATRGLGAGGDGDEHGYGYSWYGQCGGGWSWGAWFGFSCGFPAYDYHPYDYPYYHDPYFAHPVVAGTVPPVVTRSGPNSTSGAWREAVAWPEPGVWEDEKNSVPRIGPSSCGKVTPMPRPLRTGPGSKRPGS